jgi:hypothetical protein
MKNDPIALEDGDWDLPDPSAEVYISPRIMKKLVRSDSILAKREDGGYRFKVMQKRMTRNDH